MSRPIEFNAKAFAHKQAVGGRKATNAFVSEARAKLVNPSMFARIAAWFAA